MRDFVHLHVHTEFSLLDGACRINKLAERLKEIGQNAIAITDHGVMYGVIDFYRACKKEGIKPIIGCECYVAPRTRFDKDNVKDRHPNHLILLCENETGYHHLIKMVSDSFTEGFYKRPRIDMDLLREHHEGLICLSACLSGKLSELLAQDEYNKAKELALEFEEIFGKDHYYMELQDHGIAVQKKVIEGILKIHRETGIPVVATNDAHYLSQKDARMQDILMCIQTGALVEEENRMRFETEEFYLKSGDEMQELFSFIPEALDNTRKIADRCNVEFEFGHYHLPEFPLPAPYTDSWEYFKDLCFKGFSKRYPDATAEIKNRLDFEMNMIRTMGFVDYFLIVSDFIAFAKNHDIPVGPGRGSAAGSMVTYCMEITDVDPLQYDLYFERFLNPERVTMPDIDVDFCYSRRQEVIDYVTRKYGADHVAQIVTFGTMAARVSVRDVGRVLNLPYADVDVIAKLIPNTLHMTLDKALEVSPKLNERYQEDPKIHDMIDIARSIEGMPRHASTHAAGVVITGKPVSEYVPLAKNEEATVTQFGMVTLEELGLLKMDFLGLRNLTVIHDAEVMIRKAQPDFDIRKIPVDDEETYKMLSEGRTCGVFQLESSGMTGVCVSLSPQSIEDITAVVALYRPGPMDSIPMFIDRKIHPEHISYLDPRLEDILSVTYGCIVYQEQVQQILRKLGGFSLGQADVIRRAMSKKKMAEILRYREIFIDGDPDSQIPGAVNNGVKKEVAEKIYDEIIDFANYAFNKAHAVSYAIVSYQTAYLKCHYPREYMAALLTSVLDSSDKVSVYISECKEMGIEVLPPDVNYSDDTFTVAGGKIHFGLVAVKHVGRSMIHDLMRERKEGGNFRSLHDFLRRMSRYDVNKRAIESLIRCGAMDSLHHHRSTMLNTYQRILEDIQSERKKNIEGQIGLFGMVESAPTDQDVLKELPEYPEKEKIAMEKEILGFYLSGHPLKEYREEIRRQKTVRISELIQDEEGIHFDGENVRIAGIITSVTQKTTKNNTMMAYVNLEDESGVIEFIVFSNVLKKYENLFRVDLPVILTGRISEKEDRNPQVLCDRAELLENHVTAVDTPAHELPADEANSSTLWLRLKEKDFYLSEKVKSMLTMFPGKKRVILYFEDTGRKIGGTCTADELLLKDLQTLIGRANVVLK